MINVLSYQRPESLEEALDLMARRDLTPIAGGTDIIPQMRDGEPRALIDTHRLGLDYVKADELTIEIGSTVTHSGLCHSADINRLLPLLSTAAGAIGSVQIRNRGTIGGNIVNASPSADTLPALLNYDAEVGLVSKTGKRSIKLADFVRGPYATDRKPGELVSSVVCKALGATPGARTSVCFLKLGRRNAMSISRVSLALSATTEAGGKIKSARVSVGSIFPVAKRMLEVERLLGGQVMSKKLFEEAGVLATELLVMETGIRWSSPYKMPVLKGLIERALSQVAKDCGVILK
jgi:CO/xanthine dehydrogenase FAD-binding subunit